jgi:hypothetical protein
MYLILHTSRGRKKAVIKIKEIQKTWVGHHGHVIRSGNVLQTVMDERIQEKPTAACRMHLIER